MNRHRDASQPTGPARDHAPDDSARDDSVPHDSVPLDSVADDSVRDDSVADDSELIEREFQRAMEQDRLLGAYRRNLIEAGRRRRAQRGEAKGPADG